MKKLNYMLIMLCLALYSCSMTDVWKEWENEGTMSPDRLKPSEVKKILCAADGWKLNYKGTIFFFEFDEGGFVTSDTDETLLENKVESDYHLDYSGEKSVLLTLDNSGALKYLSEGVEKTLVITAYSDQKITARGKDGGLGMDLVPVTKAEIQRAAIAKNKALFLQRLKTDFSHGVIRDANSKFVAHYTLLGEEYDHINISVLENRVLSHYQSTSALTVNDENGILTFDAVVINGKSTTQIIYNFASGKMATDSKLNVEMNNDPVSFFTSSDFKTYKISKNNNLGDAKEEIWQELGWKSISDIELSDREVRPLVLCPGSENAIWYTFFDANLTTTAEKDIIYFHKSPGYMPFGGDNRVAEAEQMLSKFLAAWFHKDGFYMVKESSGNTSFIYFLSPTTDNWVKVQK